MVIALPRLQTATTKRCENASASVKLNYRSLPVGPRVVRMIDVSTYEGADFMGDRLRHVGSAVPRTSGLAEPHRPKKCSKLKLFLKFPTISIIYLINKINITKYGHFLKKIHIIFQNFLKNVIIDLYKLCFQNYCASLISVVIKKNN